MTARTGAQDDAVSGSLREPRLRGLAFDPAATSGVRIRPMGPRRAGPVR
ncbi:hypothetical protein ACWD6K_21835 [Streptomyces sp. NPDC002431]